MEGECCCCNYTFPENADPRFKVLLDKLNSECLNKDKKGFIPWVPINLLRNTRDGREGGRYTCIGVTNKTTGLTIYNICSQCDKTITKHRKFPFTSGVDVSDLYRKHLEATKTITAMQQKIDELEKRMEKIQQTTDELNSLDARHTTSDDGMLVQPE